MVGGMVATGFLFFPAAPFFLFMHGHEITIPKGTETTAYVNGTAHLDIRKFRIGGREAETGSHFAPAAQSSGVTSVPVQFADTPARPVAPSKPDPPDDSNEMGENNIGALGIMAVTWQRGGAEITEIELGSVAERAYLHVGDVITSVNGRAVRTSAPLAADLAKHGRGSQVRIGYLYKSISIGYVLKETVVIIGENR
jgi:membrane-associated protease RseP (regulator of RpoE activity)